LRTHPSIVTPPQARFAYTPEKERTMADVDKPKPGMPAPRDRSMMADETPPERVIPREGTRPDATQPAGEIASEDIELDETAHDQVSWGDDAPRRTDRPQSGEYIGPDDLDRDETMQQPVNWAENTQRVTGDRDDPSIRENPPRGPGTQAPTDAFRSIDYALHSEQFTHKTPASAAADHPEEPGSDEPDDAA
jgi:hypothetical protein